PYRMKRITQKKGDLAVSRAIFAFTKKGFDVSLPVTESAAYDLIVDDGSKLYRVQVRYSSSGEVDLRRIHSNSQGYVIKKVSETVYDWLYVLTSDEKEYLIRSCYIGRRSVKVTEKDIFC
ncbi:hypothetical protein EBT31_14740, partial [bacterium]|nr:hypothetical protein [bacterium]